jgi:CopG family transcriptional regulator/antitoxin EndoAI
MRMSEMRTMKVISLSLPPDLLKEAEKMAKKEGRTRSELFREALRRYIREQRWEELQRYGALKVKELGLREEDVERLIEEYRKKQNKNRG